ncbi:universal stress protein [Devosia sp. RR2S18]|uniref:universal stress protein n=1 Tax=Devosia rhizosphaerae TaxID=3049774 RepID=UPI0025414214|nr:universal stress protein [Devosia sp. RR2S18]WIJ24339.1 universal stress protein [Devosia sp. RR2S18]
MYTKILIATDGSDLSTKALRHGLGLARLDGAKVVVMTATEPSMLYASSAGGMIMDTGQVIADLERTNAEAANHILEGAKKVAAEGQQTIEVLHVAERQTADAILDTAKDQKADLIVMGSHGRRGIGRLLLGSQAAEVLARSSLPVLIVK